jgi:hypothetical protein
VSTLLGKRLVFFFFRGAGSRDREGGDLGRELRASRTSGSSASRKGDRAKTETFVRREGIAYP